MLGALVAVSALSACGADDSSQGSAATDDGTDVRYIVHMAVDAPDGRVNYFSPVASLDEETTLDLAQSLEVPGTARLYAPPSGGFFSVGSSSDLSITRYDVAADGTLTESGVLSLQNQGINNLFRTMAFIDAEKAYYLDELNARIIVWNPLTLTITGSIELPMVARAGLLTKFVRVNYVLRPGRLVTSVTWADELGETLAPETGLLVIDTAADAVAAFEVDGRCMGAAEVVEMPNGDAYFASGPDEIVQNTMVRGASRPGCVLRVNAGEERFDPSYLVALSEVARGRAACDILPSGEADTAYFRVLDETLGAWTLENDDVDQEEVWEWWRLNVTSGLAEPVPSMGLSGVYTTYSRVADQVLVTRQMDGGAQSQLLRIEAGGGITPGLTAPGFLWAAVKVR